MPHAWAEALLEVAAEPAPVALLLEQVGAGHLVDEVQCLAAGAELLEHHQVDPVGPHLERRGQVLPHELALAQRVGSKGDGPEDAVDPRLGQRVGGGQQGDTQGLAEQPGARGGVEGHVDLGVEVGYALQDPVTTTKKTADPPELAPRGMRGGQGPRAVAVTVHLVPRIGHGGHAQEALVESGVDATVDLAQLVAAGGLRGVGRPAQPHHRGADVGVAEERRDVGPQWQVLDRAPPVRRSRPGLLLLERLEHRVAGQGLDAAEQVGDVDGARVHARDGAVAHQDRGHPVADGFAQARGDEKFDVVVGVGVHEPGCHPPPLGFHDLCAGRDGQWRRANRGHDAGPDPDVRADTGGAGAVEDRAPADDDVEVRPTRAGVLRVLGVFSAIGVLGDAHEELLLM